jgi:hypothetical protein
VAELRGNGDGVTTAASEAVGFGLRQSRAVHGRDVKVAHADVMSCAQCLGALRCAGKTQEVRANEPKSSS